VAIPLKPALARLAYRLDDGVIERLERYRDLIVAATREFNLTALRDPDAIDRRHIVEAVAFVEDLEHLGLLPSGAAMLDLGTGAGLPGIPMKLVRPDLRLALLESEAKKCAFLRTVVSDLDLDDTDVLEGRAEDFGRDPAHRECYDLVVARAVAPLPVLVEYALPFLRVGGHLAGTKGSALPGEVARSGRALRELGGELVEQAPFAAPFSPPQTIVVVRKLAPTPERFPRRVGVAAKRPLA
jgi:16S rRNA (guanine527-N7)-methyltransferase